VWSTVGLALVANPLIFSLSFLISHLAQIFKASFQFGFPSNLVFVLLITICFI
jgi:hypothetical protein